MPRPPGDHEARRREVAHAVHRVLAKKGFEGLTVRAVATELGRTTGVVTHYFSSKHELQAFALDMLERSVDERERPAAEPGMPALRAAVLGMLPLTETTSVASRIWISSWDIALADPELTARYANTYRDSRARLGHLIRQAQQLGHVGSADADQLAAMLHSFALGLSVQAVLDPDAFPATTQTAMVDAYLHALATNRSDDDE